MTAEAIALAVRDLCPAETFLGEVPSDAPLPWRSVAVSMPSPAYRSDAATVQGGVVTVGITVSTATLQGTLRIAQQYVDALESVAPDVTGWSCGPLLQAGEGRPYATDVVVQAANRRLHVVHLTFRCTVSRRT